MAPTPPLLPTFTQNYTRLSLSAIHGRCVGVVDIDRLDRNIRQYLRIKKKKGPVNSKQRSDEYWFGTWNFVHHQTRICYNSRIDNSHSRNNTGSATVHDDWLHLVSNVLLLRLDSCGGIFGGEATLLPPYCSIQWWVLWGAYYVYYSRCDCSTP